MDDGHFQWDDAKAISNVAAHGVTFESARRAFSGPLAIDWLDESEDYGEGRYCLLGMVGERVLFVAYTMRSEAIRIISARGAEAHERRRYHQADLHD